MSLFVLREGYRVVTTRSGARVVHVRTGGSIDLSPEEVLLFARATAGGVDVSDPKLRNLVRRFVTLGVLVSAGGPAGGEPNPMPEQAPSASPAATPPLPSGTSSDISPRPPLPSATSAEVGPRPPPVAAAVTMRFAAPPTNKTAAAAASPNPPENSARAPTLLAFPTTGLAPPVAAPKESTPKTAAAQSQADTAVRGEDIARLMRGDLKVTRRPSSSLLEVTDPRTGKAFPLYDFELSLARMLDGKRLYREVVDAGQRLGIPVDLQSLAQFVSQLDRYGFLTPAGTPPPEGGGEESTWAPRRKWDDGLRALFQSGLRMHRQGRYAEAANYFEAMLQQDPENPEATDMLGQCRLRMSGGAQPAAEPILAPPDSAQVSLEKLFFSEDADEKTVAELPPPRDEAAPERPPASVAPSKTAVRNAERLRTPEKRRSRWPIFAGIACSLLAVSASAWYLLAPKRESSPKLRATKVAKSEPPKAAIASAAKSDAGVGVPIRPEATAELTARSLSDAGEPRGVQQIADRPGARNTLSGDAGLPPEPRVATAQATSPADAGVPSGETQRAWIAAKLEHRGRVTMAEVSAPASGILSWRASPNQRVRRGDTVGSLRDRRTARERPIRAPKEGLLIPKVHEDESVSLGQPVAAIVYHEAYLQASLADARPQAGWQCEVYQEDSSERAACKIIEVVRRGSKSLVTATTEPLWFDTARDARVRVSPPQ